MSDKVTYWAVGWTAKKPCVYIYRMDWFGNGQYKKILLCRALLGFVSRQQAEEYLQASEVKFWGIFEEYLLWIFVGQLGSFLRNIWIFEEYFWEIFASQWGNIFKNIWIFEEYVQAERKSSEERAATFGTREYNIWDTG